jgi:hypothetical protein
MKKAAPVEGGLLWPTLGYPAKVRRVGVGGREF